MHDDRTRLREALAAALAAAQDARAPARVVGLLEGAFRSLESTRYVDDDMIRWAEASLGAWRRWSPIACAGEHRLLVVDPSGGLASAVQRAAIEAKLGSVRVVTSRTSTLEALATDRPTAIVFDLDGELAPTTELLDWLAMEFPQIRRIGCARDVGAHQRPRTRAPYNALIAGAPDATTLRDALAAALQARTSVG